MGRTIYSVSKVIAYLRGLVNDDMICRNVTIRGEISDVHYHSASGHTYFILREGNDQLSCILFASDRKNLKAPLQDGKEMECEGRIGFYHRPAGFSFCVKNARLSGEGQIYEEYLKTKQEMEEAGMFAPEYKRPIPRLVRRLGVVSSASGDVRSDIESVAKRRNPFVEILLCPAYVQGERAILSIERAIGRLAAYEPDVIIVARGGGSDADMEVFNSRIVAEAVFNCPVPVISAIGHTPYEPILNLVADAKAGTPSEAAEKAVCDIAAVSALIRESEESLVFLMNRRLEQKRFLIREKQLELLRRSPSATLLQKRGKVEEAREELSRLITKRLEQTEGDMQKAKRQLETTMEQRLLFCRNRLQVAAARLDSLSPLKRIMGGYAYVEDTKGNSITGLDQIAKDDRVRMYFKDGLATARIESLERKTLMPEEENG
ncbi:MAG: exodeoxyribonuclease VII large subunit [Lachnospiraceae bacterium]|nr:exodeoxyribonuclease VII large subunit [Lachnospiraceae bacterium]